MLGHIFKVDRFPIGFGFGWFLLTAGACATIDRPVSQTVPSSHHAQLCVVFQETLDEVHREAGFPGATAALRLGDGRSCQAASGVADMELSQPIRTDHRMPAGSIGKTFVAAAALSLIGDGLLTYDTKAETFLGHYPWFSDWPNAQDITIGHLLTHSSGVPTDYIEQPELLAAFNKAIELDTTLESLGITHVDYASAVAGTEPAFPAGGGFHYTDVSYVLVALIVEAAAGKTLEKYIEEQFIEPLSLGNTAPQKRDMPNVASGYIPEPYRAAFGGVPEKSHKDGGGFVYDPEFEWGGGGYVSTAGDLAEWARAWFGGSALPEEYLEIQQSNVDMRAMETLQAGYGPGIQFLPNTEFGDRRFHRGYMLGYISVTEYLPRYDLSVSLMINTIDTSYTDYHNLLVGAIVKELPTE